MFQIITSVRCDKCGCYSPWSVSSRSATKRGEALRLAVERGWCTKPLDESPAHHFCPPCSKAVGLAYEEGPCKQD